jgi:hypothetical protein
MRAAAYLGIDDDMDSRRVIQRVAKRHGERVRRTFPASSSWRSMGSRRRLLPGMAGPAPAGDGTRPGRSVAGARKARDKMRHEMTCPMSSSAAVSLGLADLCSCACC